MEYRGYKYQTIACDHNEDIYEVIGIKENQKTERKENEYYFNVYNVYNVDVYLIIYHTM